MDGSGGGGQVVKGECRVKVRRGSGSRDCGGGMGIRESVEGEVKGEMEVEGESFGKSGGEGEGGRINSCVSKLAVAEGKIATF